MRRLGYVPALDGIRGIAITAVVCCHYFGLPGGFYGVDLFFVLSGFLITTILLEHEQRLREFYVRRARRLLPALGLLLGALLLLGWKLELEGGLYASNFFRAFARPDPLDGTPLGHLWSLAEEEQFYLVWPVVLLALTRRGRNAAKLLVAIFVLLVGYRATLSVSGAGWERLYYAPDTHADGLVLGCLAAIVRPRLPRLAWVPALFLIVAIFALAGETPVWQSAALPVFEIAAAVLTLAAVSDHAPVLSFRPLVWLGLISYSLYLWHEPAHWLLGWHHPWFSLPLALALAFLSYRFVEQPFRRPRSVPARVRGSEPRAATT